MQVNINVLFTPRELKNGVTFKAQKHLYTYRQSYNFSLFHALLLIQKLARGRLSASLTENRCDSLINLR